MRPRPQIPAGPYLVVGLARSGAAAARVLRERGERVIGVDAGAPRPGAHDAPSGAGELAQLGVEAHLHCDDVAQLAYLDRARAVVKSPGVPAQAPVIAAARARGIPVLGELELAWRLLANEFIAVTGTNGKTTTVQWIGHIHREAGLPAAVAGNVGAALSGLVGRIEERAIVVCEVSSFQLEDTLTFAPEAAVLLNITPDHLDRHGTLEAYREAKLQIFARQQEGDVAVIPAGPTVVALPPGVRRVRVGAGVCAHTETGAQADVHTDAQSDVHAGAQADVHTDAQADVHAGAQADVHADAQTGARVEANAECILRDGCLWWEGESLVEAKELRLRGEHNLQNAMAAAAVCLARGLDRDAVRAGLRSFAGVPHRLEEVARRDGVLYVNDSKATNVASTLVALQAFPEGGVHLILGGQGKGQDFTPLRDAVAVGCRAVYLIGEDSSLIAAALGGAAGLEGEAAAEGAKVRLCECGDLERAVAAASTAARAGETVLLSPACASFDQFVDFEARGERFTALVSQGV